MCPLLYLHIFGVYLLRSKLNHLGYYTVCLALEIFNLVYIHTDREEKETAANKLIFIPFDIFTGI